jgi:hypothetical protein
MNPSSDIDSTYTLQRGNKKYEGTNHLSNVLVVYSQFQATILMRINYHSKSSFYHFGLISS